MHFSIIPASCERRRPTARNCRRPRVSQQPVAAAHKNHGFWAQRLGATTHVLITATPLCMRTGVCTCRTACLRHGPLPGPLHSSRTCHTGEHCRAPPPPPEGSPPPRLSISVASRAPT
eukprot:366010-Chlamydomonas_euryale.AAC.8